MQTVGGSLVPLLQRLCHKLLHGLQGGPSEWPIAALVRSVGLPQGVLTTGLENVFTSMKIFLGNHDSYAWWKEFKYSRYFLCLHGLALSSSFLSFLTLKF